MARASAMADEALQASEEPSGDLDGIEADLTHIEEALSLIRSHLVTLRQSGGEEPAVMASVRE